MSTLFTVLMIIAALSAFGALVIGVFGMAKGGEFNRKHSNKLMRARIIMQGLAILLFCAVAALSTHK